MRKRDTKKPKRAIGATISLLEQYCIEGYCFQIEAEKDSQELQKRGFIGNSGHGIDPI